MVSRRRFGLLVGICVALAAAVLLALPTEKTIGWVIKLVYLHGALSRAGMIGFAAGGVAGALYLLFRRPIFAAWCGGLTISGCGFWVAHFLVSMPATRLTWGPWIAWGEPRVTMTLQVIGAGLAILIIDWLVANLVFACTANALLGGAVVLLAERTGVLRHPLDPIGTSPSVVLRLAYGLLLVPVIAAMVLTAWRLTALPVVQSLSAGRQTGPESAEA